MGRWMDLLFEASYSSIGRIAGNASIVGVAVEQVLSI